MGHSHALASSRCRSHHEGPKPKQDHDSVHRDPILGQLVKRYLAGEIELTQPVLVGLHRSLGSPARVQAAIAARRGASAPAGPDALAARITHQAAATHVPKAAAPAHADLHEVAARPALHATTDALAARFDQPDLPAIAAHPAHEAHHSIPERLGHFLHELHVGETIAHGVAHAAHGATEVAHAMGELSSGATGGKAFDLVSDALTAERTIGGKLTSLIGKGAAPVVKALSSGTLGKVLSTGGKVLSSPLMKYGLGAANVALSTYNGAENAAASTTGGKLAVGAGEGLGAAAMLVNPLVGVADAVLPDAVKPSKHLSGALNGITAIAEGAFNKDERAMEKVHERSLKGEYGWVLKQASRLGDAVAEHL